MQDKDVICEFLVESHENLSRLDQELVELETAPNDVALLASVFRTIHTIKGTCGFLGFSVLEKVTHQAESLLSQLRDGKREVTPTLISLILETVDATRTVLASIEVSGEEGPERFEELTERLRSTVRDVAIPEKHAEPATSRVGESEQGGQVGAPAGRCKGAVADGNIRVGVGLLDKLMDLVGELVLTRNQILQYNTDREDAALNATSQRLNLITSELQEGVMKTRMQPIGMVWNKLPRVVRDMAVALGKQIRVVMDGAGTELDRTIIEAINDPLVHLVRNACDHGIESPETRARAGKPVEGTLTLRAYHEGGQVNIEISDDGAGMDIAHLKETAVEKGFLRPEQVETLSDREALNLIFRPAFSTAKTVTKVSGRGVGMDVVKSHVEKIGGVVDIFSRLGEGTTVKVKIPLTLAIIPGLVIACGGERFVIPQVSLLELIRLDGESSDKRIEQVHGTPVYRRRGSLLPVAYLDEVLGLQSDKGAEAVNMVVLQAEDRQFGLVVDAINDTQEIVVKPLGKQLKGLAVYAGATIMGDGRVALILDVLGVGQRSGVLAECREQSRGSGEHKTQGASEQQRLLLFRAGSFDRLAVPLSLVARLEEFPRGAIERAGGTHVVQYRNRILPLVTLRDVLEPNAPEPAEAPEQIQVIVFNDGDRSVGVVVDHILDVAEETVTVRHKSARKGLLGSAVVGKQVTDFLDLSYVIEAGTCNWLQGREAGVRAKSVLLAEASTFSRGLIRSGLDMEGYQVLEAGSVDEAIRGLEQQAVDIVIASSDLSPVGAPSLRAAMRSQPEWERIPVLELVSAVGQLHSADCESGSEERLERFDRLALLASVARLASHLTEKPAGGDK